MDRAADSASCLFPRKGFSTADHEVSAQQNGILALGRSERARTSASLHEILNAMWLFNIKFEQARTKFEEVKERGAP
jgi:hypothetical protein